MNPVRTLAVMHLADVTGPAKSLFPRLQTLAARGELVTVVPAPGSVGDLYSRIGAVVVRPYDGVTRPPSPRAALRAAARFARDVNVFRGEINRRTPDLVVVATATLPAALLASRLERVPAITYIAEILDRRPRDGLVRYAAQSALSRLTLAWSSTIVSASEAVTRNLPGSTTRIVTIPPGFSLGVPTGGGAALRERLGVPLDAFCLAVAGSISIGRGHDVLVRALPEILARLPDTYCVLAGVPHRRAADLAYRDRLLELTRALGLADRLILAGFVDPIEELYAAADVVVNPVRMSEAFGRVAFEAFAAGKPVVASRVGAIPELLVHERHALLVEPDDPAALRDAVCRLAADDDLRARLAEGGRDLVRRRFREADGVRAFSAVVDDVIGERVAARGDPERE
jgi:glycosyltransferase involved in cell wall biosynthesis